MIINRLLTYRWFVVYRLPLNWNQEKAISLEFKHAVLDQDQVHYFFRNDQMRVKTFCKFIVHGFRGIVWYEADEWISYAWMSTPVTLGPPHLPRWIKKLPIYWIFYCRTKGRYQGRGLFKASISLLARWAREKDPNAQIYIDTEPNNIPSRRAIESIGFSPVGVITTLNLNLPKVNWVLWGKWDKEASHPEMPKEIDL
ncbi:MAG: GNAT family N-acetyltransferase [Candidatus Bathyarchaeia archaeon]